MVNYGALLKYLRRRGLARVGGNNNAINYLAQSTNSLTEFELSFFIVGNRHTCSLHDIFI